MARSRGSAGILAAECSSTVLFIESVTGGGPRLQKRDVM